METFGFCFQQYPFIFETTNANVSQKRNLQKLSNRFWEFAPFTYGENAFST